MQIARSLIAIVGRLPQTPMDAATEAGRQLAAQLTDGFRGVAQNGRDELGHGVALKRSPARQDLVKDDAQREDVGARVDGQALGQFRRQVGSRSQNGAITSEAFGMGLIVD